MNIDLSQSEARRLTVLLTDDISDVLTQDRPEDAGTLRKLVPACQLEDTDPISRQIFLDRLAAAGVAP